MKEYLSFLNNVPLFRGFNIVELESMLKCLGARKEMYNKNDIIIMEGDSVPSVGIVLYGVVQIIKEDYMGNRNIVAEISKGNLFAESFSCVQTDKFPMTALSISESEVLWVDYKRITTTCSSACRFHHKLIENMLSIIASKNILLSQKIEYISKRTTGEKILSYLSDQAEKNGSCEFDIPFNRQELADFLCVDRSALSIELGKLQKKGILKFHLNHFCLLMCPNK